MAAARAAMTTAARSSVRGMAQICGFHHVSLPASDLDRSSDWYERVFSFRVLIEEDENPVTMVMLERPEGMLLCLHHSPDLGQAWHGLDSAVAVVSFRVASRADLVAWDRRLAGVSRHTVPAAVARSQAR